MALFLQNGDNILPFNQGEYHIKYIYIYTHVHVSDYIDMCGICRHANAHVITCSKYPRRYFQYINLWVYVHLYVNEAALCSTCLHTHMYTILRYANFPKQIEIELTQSVFFFLPSLSLHTRYCFCWVFATYIDLYV